MCALGMGEFPGTSFSDRELEAANVGVTVVEAEGVFAETSGVVSVVRDNDADEGALGSERSVVVVVAVLGVRPGSEGGLFAGVATAVEVTFDAGSLMTMTGQGRAYAAVAPTTEDGVLPLMGVSPVRSEGLRTRNEPGANVASLSIFRTSCQTYGLTRIARRFRRIKNTAITRISRRPTTPPTTPPTSAPIVACLAATLPDFGVPLPDVPLPEVLFRCPPLVCRSAAEHNQTRNDALNLLQCQWGIQCT